MYRLFILLLFAVACAPRPTEMGGTTKEAVTMENSVPMPSAWRIVEFTANGKTSPALNDKGFVALRDGQIGGHTGCNAFGGEYTGSATKMKVGGVMATKMYCQEVSEQERAVLDLFNGTVTAEMDGKMLVLNGSDCSLRLERDDAYLKKQ